MNGKRKPPKLTAKEALKRNEQLELQAAMLKLEIRKRTANFLTQLAVFEGIFNAVLEDAGTVGEARRWYKEWCDDVNGLNIQDDNYNEQIQALLDKHGFEFSLPDHAEYVDKLWEGRA